LHHRDNDDDDDDDDDDVQWQIATICSNQFQKEIDKAYETLE